jgi:HEAT repeat protein
MEDKNLKEVLVALDKDERVAIPLLYRLSDLTPDDLSKFCNAWPDFDEERRRVILRHLADISEENFEVDFSDIFAFCLADVSSAVRKASLDGLWDTERLTLVQPIIYVMLNDENVEVRALAAATLGHLVLMAEWKQIPDSVTKPIVRELLAILDDKSTPMALRRSALESISTSSHQRVPQLIENAYTNGDLEFQISALYAMGRSADDAWLPDILEEMSNSSFEMRLEAARAAGSIGHIDAVQGLAELLVDNELEVRLTAVTSLGKIGGARAQELLETLTEDSEYDELNKAALDSLEEMTWLGGEIDLSLLDWENSDDAEPYLSV